MTGARKHNCRLHTRLRELSVAGVIRKASPSRHKVLAGNESHVLRASTVPRLHFDRGNRYLVLRSSTVSYGAAAA